MRVLDFIGNEIMMSGCSAWSTFEIQDVHPASSGVIRSRGRSMRKRDPAHDDDGAVK